MSISQMSSFLNGISNNESTPNLYFMYEDHFSHEAFQKHFVATKNIAFGFLESWTWHINAREKPNIRYTFKHQRDDLLPEGPVVAPATKFAPQAAHIIDGTFGFVIELTPELKSALKKVYDANKVAMVQDIQIYVMNPNGHGSIKIMIKALVYWDPLYTTDGVRRNLLRNAQKRAEWKSGLMTLKKLGVPDGWVNAVQRRLVGERVDPEPLFADFPRCPMPPSRDQIQRIQHNYRLLPKLPIQPYSSPRVTQQMRPTKLGSSSGPKNSNEQHNSVAQVTMGPPARPSTVVQHEGLMESAMVSPGRPISCPPMNRGNGAVQSAMAPIAVVQHDGNTQRTMRPPPNPMSSAPMGQHNSAVQGPNGQGGRAISAQPNLQQTLQHNSRTQNPMGHVGGPVPGQSMAQHQASNQRPDGPVEQGHPRQQRPNIGPEYQRLIIQLGLQGASTSDIKIALYAHIQQHGPPKVDRPDARQGVHATMAPDGRILQIHGLKDLKRKIDLSGDRLAEDLKRARGDGVGGNPALAT